MEVLVNHGLVVSLAKSSLIPSQCVVHLGAEFDTKKSKDISISKMDRQDQFHGYSFSVSSIQLSKRLLLGQLAAIMDIVSWTHLYMHPPGEPAHELESNKEKSAENFSGSLGRIIEQANRLAQLPNSSPGGVETSPRGFSTDGQNMGDVSALLPMLTEQLQWMPAVNPKLHMPLVKFTFWTLRQLDKGKQQATLISTMRRLGEEIFKGTVTQEVQDSSTDQVAKTKTKCAFFFKSSSLPLRFVSTLIILKTINQADYLAQAFDTLRADLKTEEGKALFLEYQAVPVILNHMKASNKGLLSNAVDIFLQMTVESRYLQHFLEACSNEDFFRCCSMLLRNPKLEVQALEKISIILQKLSKIKSNKKLFELFTIHLMIQELHRTANPDHAFLVINLNSILFNLGMSKGSALTSSLGSSH
nr:PREDICTED: coiled-coil domain-containing protein 138 [Latimeria chalumnae]|eukprot:XP_006009609.1 PREDICTED: coiled-coil domain-containing protein 138 [Latimeria chalumnae]